MKLPSLIIILAGSMLLIPAASCQANPKPASHPPVPTALAPAAQRFNLNGLWQFSFNGKTIRVQFQQNGEQFRSFAGVGNLGRSDQLLFEGKYAGGAIVGQRVTPANTRVPEMFTVDDPDHVRTSKGVVLSRISPAGADDAVCDLQNTSHTQSGYAFDRAIDANHNQLPPSVALCWTQVSAAQGNPRAEDAMAMFYRDGEGVPKNPPIAFSWAQKSAAQGDPLGQALLADFYKRGIGTSPNAQLAQKWQSKANAQTAQPQAAAAQQNTVQTAKNNGHHQLTQSEAEGLALLTIVLGSDSSPSKSNGKLPNPDDYDFQSDPHAGENFGQDCRDAGGHIQGEMLGMVSCVPGS